VHPYTAPKVKSTSARGLCLIDEWYLRPGNQIQHGNQNCQPTFLAIDRNETLPAKLGGKCKWMPITRPMALFFHSGPPFMDRFIRDLSRPLVRGSNRGGASRYRDKFLYGSIMIWNQGAPKHGERYRMHGINAKKTLLSSDSDRSVACIAHSWIMFRAFPGIALAWLACQHVKWRGPG